MSAALTLHSQSVDTVIFHCQGEWTVDDISLLDKELQRKTASPARHIFITGQHLNKLDTAGAWLLCRTQRQWQQLGSQVEFQDFNPEHTQLLELTKRYTVSLTPCNKPRVVNMLVEAGQETIEILREVRSFLSFVGENTLTIAQALFHPRRIRWQAILSNLYYSGVTALPIVGLMAFLIGIVVAYQGGMQLSLYGANILVVDLVGMTLLRELAPMLTAIIIAGRSGSSYTAQIGTMLVTEEIDALRTIGISPLDLLVLPKLLALMIALPLLTAYADVLGILGGMVIAKLSLDVSYADFLDRFHLLHVRHYLVGLGKAPIFAMIIVLIGCYHGFKAEGSADSVGRMVTISVVQAIFLVIVVDAVFAVILGWLRI